MRIRREIAVVLVLVALPVVAITRAPAQTVRAFTDSLRIAGAPNGRGTLGVVLRPSEVKESCLVTSVDSRLSRLVVREAFLAAPATGPNPNRTTFDGLPIVGTVLRIPRQTTQIQAFAADFVNEAVVREWRRG